MRLIFGLGLIWISTHFSLAQDSCLPQFNALQSYIEFDGSTSQEISLPLYSENVSGLYKSKAELRLVYDSNNQKLKISSRFDPSFHGVSLPFNIYAILYVVDGKSVAYDDFTRMCKSPGFSFFPGAEVSLGSIELKPDKQILQVTVWGRQ